VFCGTLRHSAAVSPHNLRTADYSVEARKRLAEAVSQARRAIGHEWRTTFADEAGIGIRSLEAVEAYEPTVGVSVLERIGRALGRHLRDWSFNTPREILEGGPIPSHEPAKRAKVDIRWVAREELIALLESGVEDIAYTRRLNHWRERFAAEGLGEKELLKVSADAARAVEAEL
jgi:hypothetical protein